MKKEKNANQSENSAATAWCVTDAARRRMNLHRVRRRKGGGGRSLFSKWMEEVRRREKEKEAKGKREVKLYVPW